MSPSSSPLPSRLLVVLALHLAAAGACFAQDGWASRDYDFASRQMGDFITRFERDLVNPVARGVRAQGRAAPSAAARPVSTTVPPRRARMPQVMAAAYPAERRAAVQRSFEQLLEGYAGIERQFGLARYDVAGALAAFLAGSYMGYRDIAFPDADFPPLVAQMRQILAADPGWGRTSVAARQDTYEQLAILGMLVANTQMALARHPDPQAAASMRTAAQGYLEQFLKVDAQRVRITPHGLAVQ